MGEWVRAWIGGWAKGAAGCKERKVGLGAEDDGFFIVIVIIIMMQSVVCREE